MAEMNFGGVIETVVTSKEFSLEKAREVLKVLSSACCSLMLVRFSSGLPLSNI